MFHVKLNARSIVERLKDPQVRLLRAYVDLLHERAVPLGLVARSDADRLWDRHVLDSLRGLAGFDDADRSAFDIGSGAGLPGVPLTIALPSVRLGRLVYWAGRSWDEHEAQRLERIGATAEICLKPEFQWQGPLVIMFRVFPNILEDE